MERLRIERLANPSEQIDELASLRLAWFAERHDLDPDIDAFVEEFRLWVEVEQEQREFWIGWQDNAGQGSRPIAMVNLLCFERMPSPLGSAGGWGYLCNMFVHQDFRNGGIGERLARAVVDRSRELGHERVVLSPSERSRSFWGRLGFGSTDGKLVLRYPNP